MTPAEHAALSAQVARAIGHTSSRIDESNGCMFVYTTQDRQYAPCVLGWWRFDYRDPSVALPLLEWLMRKGIFVTRDPTFPDWVMVRGCPDETDRSYPSIYEAIARAVIAVKEQA